MKKELKQLLSTERLAIVIHKLDAINKKANPEEGKIQSNPSLHVPKRQIMQQTFPL